MGILVALAIGTILSVMVAWMLAWHNPLPLNVFARHQFSKIPRYIDETTIWYVQVDRVVGAAVTMSWLMWRKRDASERLVVNDPERDFVGSLTIESDTVLQHFGGNYRYTYSDVVDSSLVPPWSFPRRRGSQASEAAELGIIVDRAWGWPMLAMRDELILRDSSRSRRFQTRRVLSGSPDLAAGRVLPLSPIWSGMVVNALFYSAVFWCGLRGAVAIRRLIRQKHGLCVKCAYDLSASTGLRCPECGWRRQEKDVQQSA